MQILAHKDLERYGGLQVILYSNYNSGMMFLPDFYKEMLAYFSELNVQKLDKGVLWNNKDLAIGGHSLFNYEWFRKHI